jgi:hypothetical protein
MSSETAPRRGAAGPFTFSRSRPERYRASRLSTGGEPGATAMERSGQVNVVGQVGHGLPLRSIAVAPGSPPVLNRLAR